MVSHIDGWNDHSAAVQALIAQMVADTLVVDPNPKRASIAFFQRTILRALSERITRLSPHDGLPTIQCHPTPSDSELEAERDQKHAQACGYWPVTEVQG